VLAGRVPARDNIPTIRGEARFLPVDHDCADSARVAEKSDDWGKPTEPCLTIDSDATIQCDLDIRKRSKRVEDVAIWARSDRFSGAHAAQANPTSRDPAVGAQQAWFRTLGEGDGSTYLR
jgi:hypothetical protein